MNRHAATAFFALLYFALPGCTSGTEEGSESQAEGGSTGTGEGDGDGDAGDGDGDAGDGDGDAGDGDGDGGPGPLDGPFDGPHTPFCGLFHFDENLGPDYDTALAAFDAEVTMTYPVHYLEVELIEAPIYDYYGMVVDREFWAISILGSEGGSLLQSLSDVLDSEGNLYWIDWCPD
jgi:hypothetical protein